MIFHIFHVLSLLHFEQMMSSIPCLDKWSIVSYIQNNFFTTCFVESCHILLISKSVAILKQKRQNNQTNKQTKKQHFKDFQRSLEAVCWWIVITCNSLVLEKSQKRIWRKEWHFWMSSSHPTICPVCLEPQGFHKVFTWPIFGLVIYIPCKEQSVRLPNCCELYK